MKKFHGLIVPIFTPVDEQGNLDREAFIRHAQDLAKRGADGLYVTGTTGEASQLKTETWREVNRLAIELFQGTDTDIYSGAVFPGTLETIERIEELEKMGAKTVFCTPTFYNTDGSQEQIIRHYEKICSSTDLQVVIYSISFTTHVDIRPETLKILAGFENVIGVKDTRSDWGTHVENIHLLKNTKVGIACVPEPMIASSLMLGSDGIVTALGNFMPEYYAKILKTTSEHDWPATLKVFDSIMKLDNVMRCEGENGVAKLKYLAHLLGICQPYTSMSAMSVTAAQKQQMEKAAQWIRHERELLEA